MCTDCGRALTGSDEEFTSGLCLRCLNGPVVPVTAAEVPATDDSGRDGTAGLLALCEQLDGLRATATPGPWWAWDRGVGWHIVTEDPATVDRPRVPTPLPEGLRTDLARGSDAALIVAAVNAVPELTAAVRRLLAVEQADPTEPPATAEQLRDLIRENQELRRQRQAVTELAEELETQAGADLGRWINRQETLARSSALGIYTATVDITRRLRRALGGGDDA